jgi:L-alanine-DL-glutamate epimerase-like enolase superfamily enzyme
LGRFSKSGGVPLWKLLADRYNGGKADESAWVYAAGGYYYPGEDVKSLTEEIRGYLDRGYSTVKMKIGGADLVTDLKRIDAALKILGGRGEHLCVDVNGRFEIRVAADIERP